MFLLLIPLQDTHPGSAQAEYDHAHQLYLHGSLEKSQLEAEQGYKRYLTSDPELAARFQLLEAEAMTWRGMNQDALRLLSAQPVTVTGRNHELDVQRLALAGLALTFQQQFLAANQQLIQAESICASAPYATCGGVLKTRGILAAECGQLTEAQRLFVESLSFARTYHDRWLETTALSNLGWVSLQSEHYDEAVDWLGSAYRNAESMGAEDLAQKALGNLGWAYYQLGDDEKALELFLEAEKKAATLGDIRYELKWISNAGYIYHHAGDSTRAAQSYSQALYLARQIDSKENIANALEDLAEISVETEKLGDASAYIDQVTPMERAGGNLLSANVMLTQGMLAAARHQDPQAERLFRAVQNNPANPTTTRLGSGDELARLYEVRGNAREAEQIYKATLTAFESARTGLKRVDSRLPFAANATGIYDHYIHMLVEESRNEEALAAADQSRAQTLAQGLGMTASKASFHPADLSPRQIAQSSGATLLFYWLGDKQSYLWVITPAKITLVPLPAQKEIVTRVERYRKTLLSMEDPQQDANEDGQALYQLLVSPAAKLIRRNTPVMILADGALGQLNFETLLAPGPSPQVSPEVTPGSGTGTHYWIEDATLLSAPSLDLLAAAKPARESTRNLLLLGNPVSPSPDYPSLPFFGSEIAQIERHFAARNAAVFAKQQATPAAYLASNPAQYAYIHFVSHAVASRTDPLDSAIILSGSALSGSSLSGDKETGDSFKLYARDIMQHPIDARLVTISACYGSGSRSYAGEGLVGLSWAFLRAGAHSVIGALWEVSDDSTPRLMDTLYQGLEDGQAPAVALRNAKLALLHSRGRFHQPFYWAPFQIYTRR